MKDEIKQPNRERDERISLCFTDEEKKQVKKLADTERLQPGVMIRKMVLDKAAELEKEEFFKQVAEVMPSEEEVEKL